MSDFLETLAATTVSAGAALSGVWISNKHTRKGQRELMQEQALTAQREMVVSLLIACREWAELQYIMVPMMQKMSFDDMAEFLELDTGKRLGALVREVHLSFTKTKLFLTDDKLRQSVTALDHFFHGFAQNVNGPILGDKSNFDHVANGIGEIKKFENALDEFEQQCITRLRSRIERPDDSK